MATQQQAHLLQQIFALLMAGTLGHGCKAQAKARRKLYETSAQKHARQFGKALGLSASDLLWGLGMVGSHLHWSHLCWVYILSSHISRPAFVWACQHVCLTEVNIIVST